MPSYSAQAIKTNLEIFLRRKLNQHELFLCEEMAFNYYTRAVEGYILRLRRRELPRTFDAVYQPVMAGLMKGAAKRFPITRFGTQFEKFFEQMQPFLEPVFSDYEIESLRFLLDEPLGEVVALAQQMKARGIKSAAYLRAAILNRQKKKQMMTKPQTSMKSALAKVRGPADKLTNRGAWLDEARLQRAEADAKRVVPYGKGINPANKRGGAST